MKKLLAVAVLVAAFLAGTAQATPLLWDGNYVPTGGVSQSLVVGDTTHGSGHFLLFGASYTPPAGKKIGNVQVTVITTKGLVWGTGTSIRTFNQTAAELEYSGGNGQRMWRLTKHDFADSNGWGSPYPNSSVVYWFENLHPGSLAVAGTNDSMYVVSAVAFDKQGEPLFIPDIDPHTTSVYEMWASATVPLSVAWPGPPVDPATNPGMHFNLFVSVTAPQSGLNWFHGTCYYDTNYVEPITDEWDAASYTAPHSLCLFNGTCNGSTACGARYEIYRHGDTTNTFSWQLGTYCSQASLRQYGEAFLLSFRFKPGTPTGFTTHIITNVTYLGDYWWPGEIKPFTVSGQDIVVSTAAAEDPPECGWCCTHYCEDGAPKPVVALKAKPVYYDIAGRKIAAPPINGVYFVKREGEATRKLVVLR